MKFDAGEIRKIVTKYVESEWGIASESITDVSTSFAKDTRGFTILASIDVTVDTSHEQGPYRMKGVKS